MALSCRRPVAGTRRASTIIVKYLGTPLAIALALAATPALAQTSTAVPEPTDAALFALGVIGLIVGRQAARRRRED